MSIDAPKTASGWMALIWPIVVGIAVAGMWVQNQERDVDDLAVAEKKLIESDSKLTERLNELAESNEILTRSATKANESKADFYRKQAEQLDQVD